MENNDITTTNSKLDSDEPKSVATATAAEEQNPNSPAAEDPNPNSNQALPRQSSRTPFTNLSQVDADLALARTLQEQVRNLRSSSPSSRRSESRHANWTAHARYFITYDVLPTQPAILPEADIADKSWGYYPPDTALFATATAFPHENWGHNNQDQHDFDLTWQWRIFVQFTSSRDLMSFTHGKYSKIKKICERHAFSQQLIVLCSHSMAS
ncbi:hypothetical protein PVL29_013697 [Vitis rotundifolia]|uniref:Uncharacterized protein n=1 Tax=Vitis rotundifolia TaxID=103349 RepID=A0AA39DQ32_VITRO|nr:hypothetical protein PVL29_013697 [Vitis rotundifolia]